MLFLSFLKRMIALAGVSIVHLRTMISSVAAGVEPATFYIRTYIHQIGGYKVGGKNNCFSIDLTRVVQYAFN